MNREFIYSFLLIFTISGMLSGCNKESEFESKVRLGNDPIIGVYVEKTGETVYTSEDYQRVLLSVSGIADNNLTESFLSADSSDTQTFTASDEVYTPSQNELYDSNVGVYESLQNISSREIEQSPGGEVSGQGFSDYPDETNAVDTLQPVSQISTPAEVPAIPDVATVVDDGINTINPDARYNFEIYKNTDNQNTEDTL